MNEQRVIYLTKDFIPTSREQAELVEVVYQDGSVMIGMPSRTKPANRRRSLGAWWQELFNPHHDKDDGKFTTADGYHQEGLWDQKPAGSPQWKTMRGTPYAVRKAKREDVANFRRGYNPLSKLNEAQRVAADLFNPFENKVIVDESGNIQAQYGAEPTTATHLREFYEYTNELDEYTGGKEDGYLIWQLSTAPINLTPTGQGGWGVAAMYAAVKEAQSAGAGFVYLQALPWGVTFYEAVGMTRMDKVDEGAYIMDAEAMSAFIDKVETYGGKP